jgi:hypothetical protein
MDGWMDVIAVLRNAYSNQKHSRMSKIIIRKEEILGKQNKM